MSDLVINVRQISNYPARTQSDGTETLLLQAGGLGAPYQSINAATFASTALNATSLGVGFPIAAFAQAGNVFSQTAILPIGGALAWNGYLANGPLWRTWRNGPAASLTWGQAGGFDWSVAPSSLAAQPLSWVSLMTLNQAGALRLSQGTLTVARDPASALEVATHRWVVNSTVASFNGRRGAVVTTEADIYRGLGLPKGSLATDQTVIARIQEMLASHPFVWSFNGRTGNIWLNLEDVERTFFNDAVWPKVPTPPVGDRSLKIANTQWVVDFAYGKLWQDLDNAWKDRIGPEGPEGPPGPTGSGFNFRGMIPTAADLPPSGNENGDLFITQDDNTGYVWDDAAGAWEPLGIISPSARVFVADTPPGTPQNGDLWWDSANGELLVWYQLGAGGAWVVANPGNAGPAGAPGPPGPPGPNVTVSPLPPANPTNGQLWFDPASQQMAVYQSGVWLPTTQPPGATVSVGPTPPANPTPGDLWFEDNDGTLMVWYQPNPPTPGQWVVANATPGPAGPPGATGPVGPVGPQGNQGVQGVPGTGLQYMGEVADQSALLALPGPHSNGDIWVTQDTGHGNIWNAATNQFDDVGPFGGGVPEAPNDGSTYGRLNSTWEALMDDGAY